MKKKIFNKAFLISGVLVLLISSGAKIKNKLSNNQVLNWNHRQLQKINKSQTEFSFAVFGDNRNSIGVFSNLISKLNKEDILFAIDDGDLVLGGKKSEFKFFLNQIKFLNKPLLTVCGNHEIQHKGKNIYTNIFGPSYYSFSIGNNYFIMLDNSNEKNLDNQQFKWLKKELKRSQKYKNRFVFMHVPLYDPRKVNNSPILTAHGLEDKKFAQKLNNLLDKSNITMLFASHIHAYYQGTWSKTPYIITGGAGAPLKSTDPEHDFYHYIKVNIINNGVKYQTVKLNSSIPQSLIGRGLYDILVLYVYYYFRLHFWDIALSASLLYLTAYLIFKKMPQKSIKTKINWLKQKRANQPLNPKTHRSPGSKNID